MEVQSVKHPTKKVPIQWKNHRPVPVMDIQLAKFPGEEWKDIPEYENYQISNYGRVKKTLVNHIELGTGASMLRYQRMLKLDVRQNKNAIIIKMALSKPGDKRPLTFSVPRFVYHLFVAPFEWRDKSIVVARKDNDPLNCYYQNLVLADAGKIHRKAVSQYDRNGIFIRQYDSIHDAAKVSGASVTLIKDAVLKKYLQGKKYFWRRGSPQAHIDISEWNASKAQIIKSKFRAVQKMTLDGQPLEIYESITTAAKALKLMPHRRIYHACRSKKNSAFGYRWRYVDKGKEQGPGIKTTNAEITGNNDIKKYNLPVSQYDINGLFIHQYPSAVKAAKAMNVSNGAISKALHKENVMLKECYWRYGDPETSINVSGFEEQRKNYFIAMKKPVQKITLGGQLLETFESITSAANSVGVGSSLIFRALQNPNTSCRGFRWRYVDNISQ